MHSPVLVGLKAAATPAWRLPPRGMALLAAGRLYDAVIWTPEDLSSSIHILGPLQALHRVHPTRVLNVSPESSDSVHGARHQHERYIVMRYPPCSRPSLRKRPTNPCCATQRPTGRLSYGSRAASLGASPEHPMHAALFTYVTATRERQVAHDCGRRACPPLRNPFPLLLAISHSMPRVCPSIYRE